MRLGWHTFALGYILVTPLILWTRREQLNHRLFSLSPAPTDAVDWLYWNGGLLWLLSVLLFAFSPAKRACVVALVGWVVVFEIVAQLALDEQHTHPSTTIDNFAIGGAYLLHATLIAWTLPISRGETGRIARIQATCDVMRH